MEPHAVCPFSSLAKQRRLVVRIATTATSPPSSGTLTLDDCPAQALEPAVLQALSTGKAEIALDVAHSLSHRVRLTLAFGAASVTAEGSAQYFDDAIPFRLQTVGGTPSLVADRPSAADKACLSKPKGASAPFRVRFRDAMSRNYVLQRVLLRLGDRVLTANPEELGTAARDGAPVTFDLAAPTGCHTLHVELLYQGWGAGEVSYLKGYRFEIRADPVVDVQSGGMFEVVAYEQDSLRFEERPAVGFRVWRPEAQ
ncbi:MAG: hypothetical protein IPJ34_07640 [Myxococcales bacterium]|nr:hypothetical protein [Myxococcales bacterium]